MLINEYDANMGKPLDFRAVDSVVNGAAGLGTPDQQKTFDPMNHPNDQGAPIYNINLAVIHGGSKDSEILYWRGVYAGRCHLEPDRFFESQFEV